MNFFSGQIQKSLIILLVGLLSVVIACDSATPDDANGAVAWDSGGAMQIRRSVAELTDASALVVMGVTLDAELVQRPVEPDITDPTTSGRSQSLSRAYFLVRFEIDSYIKGEGPSIINIVLPGPMSNDPNGAYPVDEPAVGIGREYVLFLTEPRGSVGREYYGDSYLTQGSQGRWLVSENGTEAVQEQGTASNGMRLADLIDKIKSVS